jgi:hypothetical protein
LGSDPVEKVNVATNHPEMIADIEREVEKHRAGLVLEKAQYKQQVWHAQRVLGGVRIITGRPAFVGKH